MNLWLLDCHLAESNRATLSQRWLSREPSQRTENPILFELCLSEQFEVNDEDDQTSFKIKEPHGNSKCKGL